MNQEGSKRLFLKKLYEHKSIPRFEFQEGLVKCLTSAEAEKLEELPSNEEIIKAVWSCDPSKVPCLVGST